MNSSIRIANGQGFWGDSIQAPVDLIKDGNINYLTLDYLAEVTLSIMQKQKNLNPNKGFAYDFIDLIKCTSSDIIKKNIKIITNAGGVNSFECANIIKDISNKNHRKLNVAIIQGDDIVHLLDEFIKKGVNLSNMDTGEKIDTIYENIYSANVYIDSFTIKDALKLNPDIVLSGRVSDPGLSLGPMLYEFDWKPDEYNKLASGTVAGHIVECGAQCTGGNHSRWNEVPNLSNIGYPIIEINRNSNFFITKNKQTGGIINKNTVAEQILYEMGDPKNYISPDVCIDFTSLNLIDNGDNKVYISNVKGFKPTKTYKVAITYLAGYKSTGQLTICGPNALEKAKVTSDIIWERLKNVGCNYDKKNTEYIGTSVCQPGINNISKTKINEIVLRLSVKDNDRKKVERFGKELAPVITSGPPGITGFAGGRPKAQEIIGYWPTLIDKKLIKTSVDLL